MSNNLLTEKLAYKDYASNLRSSAGVYSKDNKRDRVWLRDMSNNKPLSSGIHKEIINSNSNNNHHYRGISTR